MHQYYSTSIKEASKSVFDDDEIYEIFMCQRMLMEHLNHLLNEDPYPSPDSWKKLQDFLTIRVKDRIPPNEQLPSVLDIKLQILFDHFECIISN